MLQCLGNYSMYMMNIWQLNKKLAYITLYFLACLKMSENNNKKK